MSSKNKAKSLYEEGCNLYLHLFCEKHGFNAEYPDTCWIANNIGGVAFIGDYLVDMETMRYDIDNDIPEDQWIKWYGYSFECTALGLTSPNYKSWLKGCPTYCQEQLDEVKRLRNNIHEAQHQLDDYIKNIKPT
jgi:hypothetical protein